MKRTRNGILWSVNFNLASRRNDMNHPLSQYTKSGRKWIKRRGKEQSGGLLSSLAISTNFAKQSSAAQSVKIIKHILADIFLSSLQRVLWRLEERSSSSPIWKWVFSIHRPLLNSRFNFLYPVDFIIMLVANTKPPMCFRHAQEGGREAKTTRLMA
ncbi:hypothetical protein H5410_045656 [Solanum commersonii]|uniref:Uncharacterized protein n=1 Tax=Solanum commersonii TaxID=4109 RepID=A0A9J5XDC7_SOLCO|nr:hypothetical protein H5410_045656 [Solanum commersonii]